MKSKQGNDFLDWAYDQRQSEKRKNSIGFIVAGIASFIAIAALLVIAALLPLKEKIPVVITVNEGTGVTNVSTELIDKKITATDAMTLSDTAKYILLREEYSYHTYPDNYEKAVQMSVGKARTVLVKNQAPDALYSPMRSLKDKAQVNIIWNSFNFLSKDIISVRFVKETISEDEEIKRSNHIVTAKFEYVADAKLSLKMRIFNPLAFVVSDYQIAREGIQN
jgi:type IV secretion system protein VirB8